MFPNAPAEGADSAPISALADSGAVSGPGCGVAPSSPESVSLPPTSFGIKSPPGARGAWRARDAWKCLGMLIVFELVLDLAFEAGGEVFPPFRRFLHTGYGHLFSTTIHSGIWVLAVLYFARVETVAGFMKEFGLDVIWRENAWFVVVVSIAFRWVGHALIAFGHLRGATTTSLWGFAHTSGPERYFYLAPALMAPFYEEICMRGFLYSAFRRSYPVWLSMTLLLCVTVLTHSSQVFRSAVAFAGIGGITLFQCYLRERTGSLWSCILCHFVFNLSGAFLTLH
jgi:hypothetical protein